MTVTIELPPEMEAGLLAQAQAQGLDVADYVQHLVRREITAQARNAETDAPFWKSFTSEIHALPDKVFDKLPEDGASEHDHYLYNAPKRNA